MFWFAGTISIFCYQLGFDLLEPSLFFATTASHGVLAIDSAGGRGGGQHWQGVGRVSTDDGEGTDMCCMMQRGESRHGSLHFFFSAQKDNQPWRRGKPAGAGGGERLSGR